MTPNQSYMGGAVIVSHGGQGDTWLLENTAQGQRYKGGRGEQWLGRKRHPGGEGSHTISSHMAGQGASCFLTSPQPALVAQAYMGSGQ